MLLKSGGVPAVLSGAMISLWIGCWRSQIPSVNSTECVEGFSAKSNFRFTAFSEVCAS
jgi:hypothetical protein